MKAVLILLSSLILVGCTEHYRYPCQDPANWNAEECQRPACEAEGICPDQLTGKEINTIKETAAPDPPCILDKSNNTEEQLEFGE